MSSAHELTLTPRQKRLVRESFESVQEYSESVILLFYGRLFELAPELRALFRISIKEQAHKLMDMLQVVVDALDRFEQLGPHLMELGQRHVNYGARPKTTKRFVPLCCGPWGNLWE